VTLSYRQATDLWRLVQTHGARGVAQAALRRTTNKINQHLDLGAADLPVRVEDLMESRNVSLAAPGDTRRSSEWWKRQKHGGTPALCSFMT
jgi:hypothetical protein